MLEILAPCGNMDMLNAALDSGADAVYLGLKRFSARNNAGNFDYEALCEAVEKCRLYGVKVYLALNTLVFDDELGDVCECVLVAARAGVHAIIVQDLAVAKIIKDTVPDMPLHASTQMTVTSSYGAKLLKQMGFSRVVLARELSLVEITDICENSGIEIEVFVHGSHCVSVSGQCYMSAFWGSGERSGNRGSCAQPCRLNFISDDGEYALSLKDLSLIEHMDKLKKAGVTSIKIEGRMKRPEYVTAAVTACRKAINGEIPDLQLLHDVYSRSGFTDGYFIGDYSDMNGVRTKENVIAGTSAVKKVKHEIYKRHSINFYVLIKHDIPIKCSVFLNDLSVSVEGGIPEKAKTKEIIANTVSEQLSKLGGTIFSLGEITCEISSGLAVSVAEINQLRRKSIELISQEIIKNNTINYNIIGGQND
ncbi:MAG: U32 family peptidase [Oscillospiraceae bacterium]|nr:U32 family peptidase [Oscillospiraceae bacterium]